MPRAEFRITVPEGVWIGDITRRHPEARVRILAALADGGTGVGLAEVTGAPEAVLAAMCDAEEVVDLETIHRGDDRVLVQFETTMPLLLLAVTESGVPLEMPFDIVEGEDTWEITASHERLSELGVPYTLERLSQRIEESSLLTDRQESLLATAIDRGYYDTPRECTLTELADAAGIAKSTCSEVLHRAEGKIVKWFMAEEPSERRARA